MKEDEKDTDNLSKDILRLDFTSNNPLEEELLYFHFITQGQYDFIKRFQKAYHKQKGQPAIMLYEPKVMSKKRVPKASSPIEDIADDNRDYYNFIFRYGERNTRIIEEYFCNNLTMKRLKERYTKRTVAKEIIQKKKKNKNKIRTIEKIEEYFDERKLYDDLLVLLSIMDEMEKIVRINKEDDEYGEMIEGLREIMRAKGKRETARILNINRQMLEKIASKNKNYPLRVYEDLKRLLKETSRSFTKMLTHSKGI
jgi:hypothetical protein